MQRVSTTVIALAGARGQECLVELGEPRNLRTVLADPARPALERAETAWEAAKATQAPYLLHDADPLAAVADAWARLYDQQGPAGELEVMVHETLARWRSGAIELPDYYLVLDADSIDPTHRHWYLGFLHRAAPVRVVPVAATATAVTDKVGHLASGRWWPDLDRLLQGVERVVPDAV
jgi:hypothetical protein